MLELRPYQLLCLVCAQGADGAAPEDAGLAQVRDAIRKDPDQPVRLVCNAGDVYAYQDPGPAGDTPEGAEFNRKRDLDILCRLDLAPGNVLPARALLLTLLHAIPTVAGICGYESTTSEAWRGCPRAGSGCYEKGREKGIDALIPPRSPEEMAREKRASMEALRSGKGITIRPHILLCAVCQYGGGVRPPYADDNLPELLEIVLTTHPDLPVTMARGADWAMCAPCPKRVPGLNACVNVLGSGGLSNEKRDLDTLQRLGLRYGSTLKARDLFRLIFERIPTTQPICGRRNAAPSVWWDGCGEENRSEGNRNYEKGRRELMEKLR
ncbi:MAG: hypothetical protein GX774_12245 [Armatimonadetes bacterium]|nr:hypothetical protein [Armatimonadota bacterium]